MSAMPQGAQAKYQAALDAGRFLIQRCGACERFVHFPRELCPHCGALGLEFVAPSGGGTVHASTCVRRSAEQGGDLNVCLIDLDEGVRLMARVQDMPPADVHVGLRVRSRVLLREGRGLVVFDAEPGAAQGMP